MPRNGSGQYNLPYNWNDDKANGIKVLASRMQGQDQDIADALTGSLASDGQTALTGDLDFNSNKAVDLADGEDTQDAVVVGQAQTGELQYYGLSSTIPLGVAGVDYEVNSNPTLLEYVDGLNFSFLAHVDCLDNPVIRVDTEAELGMLKENGSGGYTNLVAGDIIQDHVCECVYNEVIGADKVLVKNPQKPKFPNATETYAGVAEIATQAEVNTGTDDARIVTALKLLGSGAYLNSANGYIKLPSWLGGFIIQWGSQSIAGSPTTASITFPTPFSSAVYTLVTTPNGTTGGAGEANICTSSVTLSSFSIQNSNANSAVFYWIAIGK